MIRSAMVLLALGALSAPVAAQERGMQDPARERPGRMHMQQQPGAKQQLSQPQLWRFQGKISELRTFNVGGEQQVLVKLTDPQDRNLVVALAPAKALQQQQIELQAGQRIAGQGVPGRIGNNPVLVATRFMAGGQQLQVRQIGQAQARAQGQQQGPQRMVTVEGELLDTMKVQLKEPGSAHTLLKLRNQNGKIAVVDAGPNVPEALALMKGQVLSVRGVPARISGQPVIVARRIVPNTPQPRQQSPQQSPQQGGQR